MSRSTRHAVVLAGGSGTRFWPRSRARLPKQLLAIAGRRTLLEETLGRLGGVVPPARVLVVTARAPAPRLRPLVGAARVLVEPVGRNTAAAIALAAVDLERRDPSACMLVLPADHVIGRPAAFRAVARRALALAERTGALVTIGVTPTAPETGYGYIRPGAAVTGMSGAAWVERFIEKPDRARAGRLLRSGRVLWNAGIFAWRVDAILAALEEHQPGVLRSIRRAYGRGGDALRAAYARLPAVSIDTGVLERADRVAVVRATFPWSDVGSWAAVEGLWRRPGQPNAGRGDVVAVDSRGCVVDAGGRVVALLGVEDLVVVAAHDAVLVARKTRAQDVRLVVDALRRRGLGRVL